MAQKLLTLAEAAERCGQTPDALRRWRYEGRGPLSGKIGRRIFYREEDLEAWIEAQFTQAAS